MLKWFKVFIKIFFQRSTNQELSRNICDEPEVWLHMQKSADSYDIPHVFDVFVA